MTRGRQSTGKPAKPNTKSDASTRQAEAIERLRQENERLRQENAEQKKRIADLERQLALRQQNSTTTSKPPSSDGLAGQQRVRGRRAKSPRRPGGQPGHPGHSRALVPPERVNAIIDFVPDPGSKLPAGVRANRGGHGIPTSVVVEEVRAAGFTHVRTFDRWPPNAKDPLFLVLFSK